MSRIRVVAELALLAIQFISCSFSATGSNVHNAGRCRYRMASISYIDWVALPAAVLSDALCRRLVPCVSQHASLYSHIFAYVLKEALLLLHLM
jgi:hypothetical protein